MSETIYHVLAHNDDDRDEKLVGTTPSLTDLQDGDLKVGLDFRRVYASVLEDWLGLPSETALAGKFERLPLFRG